MIKVNLGSKPKAHCNSTKDKVITIGFLCLIIQGGKANIRKKIIVNVKENSRPLSMNIRLGATFLGTGLDLFVQLMQVIQEHAG
ncbi:MAG: hypothetical protein ACKOHH_02245, partial [Bacteroidota bacterium]